MNRFARRILGLGILGGLAAALAKRAGGSEPDLSGAGAGPEGSAVASPPGAAPESATPGVAATPPPDTPGPSVTPPAGAVSETVRAERVDEAAAGRDDIEAEVEVDEAALSPEERAARRIEREEAAAAAEAAAIGGAHPRGEPEDPSMRPVYEAGGGEAEGFEGAEEALIRNATHDEGGGKPLRDAFRPEVESDRSGAVYAEADRLESTEVEPSEEEESPESRAAREARAEAESREEPSAPRSRKRRSRPESRSGD